MTEEAKKESDAAELLRSRAAPIIERAPLPIVEVQGEKHIVSYVNSAFCSLMGKSRRQLLGKPFREIVPGGGECVSILDQVFQTGVAAHHALQDNSEPVPAQWLFAMWPMLDETRQPVGAIIQLTKATRFREDIAAINEALLVSGLLQHELTETAEKLNAKLLEEIAERKQAEEKLRTSEIATKRERDYAEATLRTAPIPLLVLRADLRVNTANEAFYKNFQVAPDETEGALIYDLGNRQWNIPKLRELLEDILPKNNSFSHFEITHEFESIGRRTMLLNARRMDNEAGQPLRIVLAIEDITERKRAEETLRQSEERFRFMAESMPQKIFTAKPTGDIDYFNRQWMEFTGLSFAQIRDWGWLQFIHPDDKEENIRLWKHCVATGEHFKLEHRFRRHDGIYRWHLSRSQAMRDANGEIVMWVGSNTDIHDMKHSQQELVDAKEEVSQHAGRLERQVTERTAKY